MKVWWRCAVITTVLCVGTAFAAPAQRDAPACSTEVRPAPPLPPDTVPGWFGDDSSYVDARPYFGRVRRRIVIVRFASGATPAERVAAVASVCGTVVGGQRLFGEDGDYYVLVPARAGVSEGRVIYDAVERLRKQPGVSLAMRDALIGIKLLEDRALREPPNVALKLSSNRDAAVLRTARQPRKTLCTSLAFAA